MKIKKKLKLSPKLVHLRTSLAELRISKFLDNYNYADYEFDRFFSEFDNTARSLVDRHNEFYSTNLKFLTSMASATPKMGGMLLEYFYWFEFKEADSLEENIFVGFDVEIVEDSETYAVKKIFSKKL